MSSPSGPALAVGIDVGFSASSRSTGVVIVDREKRGLPEGSTFVVERTPGAMEYLRTELARLQPRVTSVCVDGPFVAAAGRVKARCIERFFASGPFASAPPAGGPRLRVSAAPTKPGSKFFASTRDILSGLTEIGISAGNPMSATAFAVETFPTLFMAVMLPPETYSGPRNEHSDDLWMKLRTTAAAGPLVSYQGLMQSIEDAPRGHHDLRAAAVCAIAADLLGEDGTLGRASFIGNVSAGGFVLPPLDWWHPDFRQMVVSHLAARPDLHLSFIASSGPVRLRG